MNEKLSYNGLVTLLHRVNNNIVSQKYYNSGTKHLFEAYARALCGQSISRFIPRHLDVGIIKDGTFNTKVKNGVTIPVTVTYKDGGIDGGNYTDKDGKTMVPYCRVSAVLFPDMFDGVTEGDTLTIALMADEVSLAEVTVDGLSDAINDTSAGIQLLLLWDLYVTNGGSE
jgi:hypothetical protein